MKTLLILLTTCCLFSVQAQYEYEPNDEYPFGRINPEAPKEVSDFAALIGECKCKSVARIDQNTWADSVDMIWRWKYIMNGWGVQDETLKADGTHSGSIRQFNADSSSWYVHYYSNATPLPTLSSWEGGMKGDNIVLYKDQTSPGGIDGYYRLTFSNISNKGFNWVGEWVTKDETSFIYPTWKIFCKRE